MTSYLSENEAKNLQNGYVDRAQIPEFGMEHLENHWRIEVSDGSFLAHFMLCHLSLTFFDRIFPLKCK